MNFPIKRSSSIKLVTIREADLAHTKPSTFIKVILWYYRAMGLTFGGLGMNKDGFYKSTLLKYWGYHSFFWHLFWNFYLTYLTIISKEMSMVKSNTFVYTILVFIYIMQCLQSQQNSIFILRHGYDLMAKNLANHTIKNNWVLLSAKIVWVVHIVVSIALMVFEMTTSPSKRFLTLLSIMGNRAFRLQILWIQPFFTYILSISMTEQTREWIKLLRTDQRTQTLFTIRRSFAKNRETINELDDRMATIQLIATLNSMLFIMIEIYVLALHSQEESLLHFKTDLYHNVVESVIRLVANCLINGLLYDQSDRLLAALDSANVSTLEDNNYREVIAFKSISSQMWNGFTIAGFMPLRRTTLMSIFTFILTYSVILLQTGRS